MSLDKDVTKGKANLNLFSITLADNKVFECRVLIPSDDEGKLADTARLVVLGNLLFCFQMNIFFSTFPLFLLKLKVSFKVLKVGERAEY